MAGSRSENRLWSSDQQTRQPGQRQNCENRKTGSDQISEHRKIGLVTSGMQDKLSANCA